MYKKSWETFAYLGKYTENRRKHLKHPKRDMKIKKNMATTSAMSDTVTSKFVSRHVHGGFSCKSSDSHSISFLVSMLLAVKTSLQCRRSSAKLEGVLVTSLPSAHSMAATALQLPGMSSLRRACTLLGMFRWTVSLDPSIICLYAAQLFQDGRPR